MRETKINRRYILIYTAACVLLGCAVFLPFITSGKSMVGNGDGQSQYILQLRYMGEWLRETLRSFAHGDFSIRSYDFTIGMGDDINAVVRFHPLDYLSVFVPAKYTEGLYTFLILLRLYLAGLSFSLYAFFWKRKGLEVLAGSLTYLFCGFVFELGIVHPIYVAPMIVMPLLLLGAEYMMDSSRRHSFALFGLMVYLGFTSNYYFMYINSVALLIYVIIRFFILYKENRVPAFFTLFIRMVSAYLVGLMMSCITLLPTLNRYFNSYRSANLSESGSLLFYDDFRRYFAWAINLISPLEASGNGTHLNFSVVVLPAIVVVLLSGRGKLKTLKWVLFSLLLFLILPLGGYIMAVMHAENNRWVYLISLAVSICVVFTADGFFRLTTIQIKGLLAATLIFDLAVAVLTAVYPLSVYHILAAAELTVFTALVMILKRRTVNGTVHGDSSGYVLAVTAVSVVLGGYFTFGGRFGNLTRFYADRGTTQSFFSDSEYANYALAAPSRNGNVWDDGFYRVDGIWDKSGEDNASLQLGYPGVQIYNSVLNASQVSYMLDTENTGLTTMLHIRSLDGRTTAEALAGVKYFQIQAGRSAQLPYGFTKRVWTDGRMEILENEHPLMFGYTVKKVIPSSEYLKLPAAVMNEVMLGAVCVEDRTADALLQDGGLTRTDAPAEASGIITQKLSLPDGVDGIERTQDGYLVEDRKASLSIPYQRKKGYDVMLELCGLVPDGMGASLKIRSTGIRKRVTALSPKQTYTLGREDYLVSLGYGEADTEDVLKIRFTKKGRYAIDSANLVYIPRSDFASRIGALNEYHLTDVSFEKNTVTGSVHLDEARFMVFQIPWSRGWSVFVDGDKAELIQADECYMGVALGGGDHDIRLVYSTPWGRAGAVISLAGLVLYLAGVVLYVKKQKA